MDTTEPPDTHDAFAKRPTTPAGIAPDRRERADYQPCDSRAELDAAFAALLSCSPTRRLPGR
jgi:hypothetical protein